MSIRNKLSIVPAVLVLAVAMTSTAQEPKTSEPDNTRVNKRDKSRSEPTADDQKNNKSDRQMTKEIRRAIVSDKSLSTYAHNIKIISQNGSVTLKGPVRSEEEKKLIEAKAAEIVGPDKITNELSIKPDKDVGKQ